MTAAIAWEISLFKHSMTGAQVFEAIVEINTGQVMISRSLHGLTYTQISAVFNIAVRTTTLEH